MRIKRITENGVVIAVIEPEGKETVICDGQSALDVSALVRGECDTDRIVVPKSAVAEKFFILSTGVAGDVLQKFVNYRFKIAIWGDFSRYTSKPLRDFIFECNEGRDVFFLPTEESAVARLARA